MAKSKTTRNQQPEIRVDYVHDRQVIIAPKRSKRPHDANLVQTNVPPPMSPQDDTFSPERLKGTKALLTVFGQKPWKIKVIKNIFPVVSPDFPNAYGYQEVVVETPDYGVELASLPETHIADVLRVYAQRARALQKDKKVRYILVFKNNGGRAGASINHAHSQVFASNYVPPHIVTRRLRAMEHQLLHNRDYYSDLLIREENGPRWIASGRHVCALTPYASVYNYEAWIMPWRRADNIGQLNELEIKEMAKYLKRMLMKLNREGLPYNYYLHQVVGDRFEHMYLRISPRRDVWAGLELGSRLVVNSVAPEDAAEFYRTEFTQPHKKPRV